MNVNLSEWPCQPLMYVTVVGIPWSNTGTHSKIKTSFHFCFTTDILLARLMIFDWWL